MQIILGTVILHLWSKFFTLAKMIYYWHFLSHRILKKQLVLWNLLKKKIKIVGITNKASAPISRYCDVQLNVISKNMLFTNSFSAVSVIINAIATQCALSNKSKAEKMLSELNKIVEEQKLVLT